MPVGLILVPWNVGLVEDKPFRTYVDNRLGGKHKPGERHDLGGSRTEDHQVLTGRLNSAALAKD
jgi:hypothetical protein